MGKSECEGREREKRSAGKEGKVAGCHDHALCRKINSACVASEVCHPPPRSPGPVTPCVHACECACMRVLGS